jgi:peptidoglycan/xylan/chitin deacetylase (PgdA/CDA1 family)
MIKKVFYLALSFISILCVFGFLQQATAQTEITKWQYDKQAAVSLTYDDGSPNQFKYALPIMDRLQLPATFFIITGPITGSRYKGEFIGRPVKEIIAESVSVSTDASNFFERTSAARYLGYKGALAFYDKADQLYESGKTAAAYRVIDTLYEQVRSGNLKPGSEVSMEVSDEIGLTWPRVKEMAAGGHEFASHTVTHAHLAVLDSVNMLYELEKSKEEIRRNLGDSYTFSAEVPYGIEDKRVMKLGLPVYPALRNLMPDTFLEEINRGYKMQPGESKKEYVQWQRGPLSKTPLQLMKSWVDTSLAHNNIWLVLVFHGVEGVGWEALPKEVLNEYFQYIKKNEKDVWVATFGDVARYIRERMNAKIKVQQKGDQIGVSLTHSLDVQLYNIPLTLKTYVPSGWKNVLIKQETKEQHVQPKHDSKGTYVLYQAYPNTGSIELLESK